MRQEMTDFVEDLWNFFTALQEFLIPNENYDQLYNRLPT